jgi:hypothetical protein
MEGYRMIAVPILVFCGIAGVLAAFAFRLPSTLAGMGTADRLFARARGLAAMAILWCLAESVFAVGFVLYAQQPDTASGGAALVALATPVLIAALPMLVRRSKFIGTCIASMALLTGFAVLTMWGFGASLLPAVFILLAAIVVESRGRHAALLAVAE